MRVKLVSITPNAEKTILYCARVSNPVNQDSESTGLLKYCIKHSHWSIFEMADICVEIETSRAISAQILRHKSFSFQEFSQRYAQALDYEVYPARRQDLKNRQHSIDDMDKDDKEWFIDAQIAIGNKALEFYEEALARGIAKEQARFLLPMSTTTKLYMKGSIRSWLHYLDLRCDIATQLEHREIAESIRSILVQELPTISQAKGWV